MTEPDPIREAFELMREWQPVTNAFSQVFDEPPATGGSGLLAGVPVAVKDLFDVVGRETTGCSRVYEGNVAIVTAPVVQRLLDEGAVIVGKTNQHELAMGATNLISACGPTANPWDPARITGGSSGGSGAAVASRVVPIALGTDTGGSIRIPASLCGVFGLKPTHGRLPLEGIMPLAPSLDCPGPMAATASDLELLWRVMSGDLPATAEMPARVGVLGGFFARRVHPDVTSAVLGAAAEFSAHGTSVEPVDVDGLGDVLQVWVDLTCDEMATAHPKAVEHRELCHPRIAGFLANGVNLDDERRAEVRERTTSIAALFDDVISGFDILIAPATPYPAPLATEDEVEVEEGVVDVHMGGTSIFTRPISLSGLPALSIPAGFTDHGLPVGVQLIAGRNAERALLATALALEANSERFRSRAPQLP